MRRDLRAIVVVLLALGCATRPAGLPAPRESGELVLWEVRSGSHARGRAWLLGSVHAASRDLALDPAIDRAFESSEALVVETDIASEQGDPVAFVQQTVQLATLPQGRTLDQVLPKPTYDRLADFMHERGQPLELYRRYEPWLILTMVTAYLFAEAGLPFEGGVDHRLVARADREAKPIVALETPTFQLTLLDSLPLDVQARMLGEVLAKQKETRADTEQLVEAWRLGDLAAIEARTGVGADAEPELRTFHEKVYVARNRAMAARIDAMLREPRTWLVVVGAGHVVGAEGIPALLAARGHELHRMPKTPPSEAPRPQATPPAPAPAP